MSTSADKESREVLTPSVKPTDYRLYLRIDFETLTFEGDESITLDVSEDVSSITLNAVDLTIFEGRVMGCGPEDLAWQPAQVSEDKGKGQVTFSFAAPVVGRGITLACKFSGKLNENLVGLYKSTYEHDGAKHVMAVSQFEAAHARRLFPCFDQPDMKATFRVTIAAPVGHSIVTNGDDDHAIEIADGMKAVTFTATPAMSTYILAVIAGRLDYIESFTPSGTRLRVYATPGKAEQGQFALEATAQILAYFEDYFGVPYALSKLDQIAVPDFAFGAMENWGAIVYREAALLVSADSSRATKQRSAEYQAHEIAHQWFGNLVTMTWWDDLWLNEAFATFMGTKAVAKLFPGFDIWTQFVTSEYGSGLSLDSLMSTHPVHVHVPTAESIDEIFDAISYNKGGALLRMLESYIGEDAFRDGLRSYMRKHAYGNTVAEDLWSELETASGKPVRSLMKEWIEQPGYPVVSVSLSLGWKSGVTAMLSQKRFRLDGGKADEMSGPDTVWQIPLSIRTASGVSTVMFDGPEMRLTTEQADPRDGFVQLNADRAGFFRVHYSRDMLPGVKLAITDGRLTPNERIAIEDDAYALCRSGIIDVSEYLDIASAYSTETEFAVWSNLLGHLDGIKHAYAGDPEIASTLARFGRNLVSNLVRRLGWNAAADEPHAVTLLRSNALRFAGDCGDSDVICEAVKRFESSLEDGDVIPADIRATVYALAVADGDTGRFRDLTSLFHATDSAEEQSRLLSALGSAGSITLRHDALRFTLTDAVRPQDAYKVFGAAAGSGNGDTLVLNFVLDRWDEIAKRHEGNNQLLGYYISYAGSCVFHHQHVAALSKFFDEKKPAGLERTIAQAIESATLKADWRAHNEACLREWCAARD